MRLRKIRCKISKNNPIRKLPAVKTAKSAPKSGFWRPLRPCDGVLAARVATVCMVKFVKKDGIEKIIELEFVMVGKIEYLCTQYDLPRFP